MRYTASSLIEVADVFQQYADDQKAMVSRQQTKRARDECYLRAGVWEDAADIVRNLTIEPSYPPGLDMSHTFGAS